jgi:hypothetical protein
MIKNFENGRKLVLFAKVSKNDLHRGYDSLLKNFSSSAYLDESGHGVVNGKTPVSVLLTHYSSFITIN